MKTIQGSFNETKLSSLGEMIVFFINYRDPVWKYMVCHSAK